MKVECLFFLCNFKIVPSLGCHIISFILLSPDYNARILTISRIYNTWNWSFANKHVFGTCNAVLLDIIIFVCKFYTTLCRSFWILDTVWFLIPTQLVNTWKTACKILLTAWCFYLTSWHCFPFLSSIIVWVLYLVLYIFFCFRAFCTCTYSFSNR